MTTHGEMPRVRWACAVATGGAAVSWELSSPGPLGPALATCAAFLLLAGYALHLRQRLLGGEVPALHRGPLRPLPPRLDGLEVAARHTPGAGGDLYEAVATAYGVRVVIGDARGHGLPALGAAGAVLAAFREAAHEEPAPADVLRRMEAALARHLAAAGPEQQPAEEFVTVLLLQITAEGAVHALNCGHPWPYRLPAAPVPAGSCAGPAGPSPGPVQLRGEALPPLGVLPLPARLEARVCDELAPGESLFLYTDGVTEARDDSGAEFPLAPALTGAALSVGPAGLVAAVHAALLHHTGGELLDDAALLALRR
ncbi:PP2C family protein-serine/threonine phosphatase [Streptomyces sp. NPDC012888]|uniref:PP2C family protein-serine/threonine phosphatase n=1 Tax=Streptomyces sp. NPDC012888 TaxID=3364855 RepID=UPI00367CCA17